MKELSIEEKARRYDEAKLRMSAAYNSNRCTIGFMNEIFPELKESENERIRKYLKRIIGEWSYDDLFAEGFRKEDILAWLEKQGEQKSDWDEDDERMLFSVIWHLRNSTNNGDQSSPAGKLEPWIRTLKDRVQPQPKQEWSKEDENMLESLTDVLKRYFSGEYGKMCIDWLKSLRPQNKTYYWTENEIKLAISDYIRGVESYEKMVEKLRCLKPHSQWKPSDAQMASITCAVRKMKESACYDSELVSLFNDLKKLREE